MANISGGAGMTAATIKRLEGEPMEEVSRPRTAGLSSGGMLNGSHMSSRVSAWAPTVDNMWTRVDYRSGQQEWTTCGQECVVLPHIQPCGSTGNDTEDHTSSVLVEPCGDLVLFSGELLSLL